MLDVAVTKRLGERRIAVAFSAADRVTALWGPSGVGKTSVLNMIAGLVAPDEGRIALDGVVLTDTAGGVSVPPHRRRIGYVFQDGRLFPHLDVRRNLIYGRWMLGLPRDAAEEAHVVALLDIGGLLRRRPASLSGGEKQRVAIGRALLARPRLLLLDEPLASLDAARKAEILPYIERVRDEARIPIVYVSHSREEVERLAERIVAMGE